MNREGFVKRSQEIFAKKHNKRISLDNINDLLDSMIDAAIEALKIDGQLKMKDVFNATVTDAKEKNGYNLATKSNVVFNLKRRIKVKPGKRIINAVNE